MFGVQIILFSLNNEHNETIQLNWNSDAYNFDFFCLQFIELNEAIKLLQLKNYSWNSDTCNFVFISLTGLT